MIEPEQIERLVYTIPVPGLPPIAVLPRIPDAVPGGRAAPPAVPGGLRPWLVLNACCNSINFNNQSFSKRLLY